MKTFLSFITTITILLLANNDAVAEPQSCPMGTITKDVKKVLQERRESTFNHCLACQGNRCELKKWPRDDNSQKFAEMCKTFFCTPVKRRGSTIVPELRDTNAMTYFTFEIDERGRAYNFVITSWSGNFNEEEALEWTKAFYKSIRYEPIRNAGEAYVITNLKGSVRFR